MTQVAIKTDPMAEFQAKLQQRVRDDIRELLPEDAVAGLVKKAVEDVFFTPRIIKDPDGWSSRDRQGPSWFVEAVTKAAEPIIRDAVAKCVASHPDAIEKVIKEFLDTNKLAVIATTHLNDIVARAVFDLQEALRR